MKSSKILSQDRGCVCVCVFSGCNKPNDLPGIGFALQQTWLEETIILYLSAGVLLDFS